MANIRVLAARGCVSHGRGGGIGLWMGELADGEEEVVGTVRRTSIIAACGGTGTHTHHLHAEEWRRMMIRGFVPPSLPPNRWSGSGETDLGAYLFIALIPPHPHTAAPPPIVQLAVQNVSDTVLARSRVCLCG